MIRAYFDESGTDDQDYVVVAGHAGRFNNWYAFMREWRPALGARRDRLHMRELRWNSRSTGHLLARLGPVAGEAGLLRILGGVRVADYAELVEGNALAQLVRGFPAALITALTALLRAAPDDEDVEVVLESSEVFNPYAAMIFTAAQQWDSPHHRKKNGEPKLSKASLLSKKSPNSWLLDQADYLSFAYLQEARNPASKKARWTAPIRGAHVGAILNRDQSRRFVSNLPPSPFSDAEMKLFFANVNGVLRRARYDQCQPKCRPQ
ncbi:MAG TPA: hypothetical protein VMV31_10115 [Terriglobales bacterium]|nr:hypothetical protein [Terriglobales bacterium]